MTAAVLLTQLGLIVVLCILGALFLGMYLDRLVGSKGICTIAMIGVGIAGAGAAVWQAIKRELP